MYVYKLSPKFGFELHLGGILNSASNDCQKSLEILNNKIAGQNIELNKVKERYYIVQISDSDISS